MVCAVWRAIGGAGEEGGAGKSLRVWAFPRARVPRAGSGSVGSGVGDTMDEIRGGVYGIVKRRIDEEVKCGVQILGIASLQGADAMRGRWLPQLTQLPRFTRRMGTRQGRRRQRACLA